MRAPRVVQGARSGISPVGLNALYAATTDTTLTSLCMSNVGVTPYGATAVAWALHRTLSLHTLDLSRNPLGKQGMHNLCEGLRGNHTVTSLE